MLILAALAAGREVVVSRGELVEIGGGFRVPDVMAQSGAILREVGTTNRTRVADYRAAIGPRTALLLRVHPSNFRIEGFTERPALDALVQTPATRRCRWSKTSAAAACSSAVTGEPTVQASVAAGVDLVCFSGDKLLGGPQAGIIVGRRELVRPAAGTSADARPARRQAHARRAGRHAARIPWLVVQKSPSPWRSWFNSRQTRSKPGPPPWPNGCIAAGWNVALVSGTSAIGGGSAPGVALPTVLIAAGLPGLSAAALEQRLRTVDPPVIARIEEERVMFDLRTVLPQQDELLAAALLGLG